MHTIKHIAYNKTDNLSLCLLLSEPQRADAAVAAAAVAIVVAFWSHFTAEQ